MDSFPCCLHCLSLSNTFPVSYCPVLWCVFSIITITTSTSSSVSSPLLCLIWSCYSYFYTQLDHKLIQWINQCCIYLYTYKCMYLYGKRICLYIYIYTYIYIYIYIYMCATNKKNKSYIESYLSRQKRERSARTF